MSFSEDQVGIKGEVWVYSRPRSAAPPAAGIWRLEDRRYNLTPTSGKLLIAKMLAEVSGFNTGVTYCEVGTSATAPALSDTNIGTVTKRNAVGTARLVGARIQWRTFFDAGDITAYLKAVGIYGHSTASGTGQTGELVGHAKIDFDNTSGTRDSTVVYELVIG